MERSRHGANRAWVDLSPLGRTVMSMKKEWLTRKDLAEMLSVSKSTIERLTTSPEFPTPIRVGGSLRYNAREVDRYLKTLREPQSTALSRDSRSSRPGNPPTRRELRFCK